MIMFNVVSWYCDEYHVIIVYRIECILIMRTTGMIPRLLAPPPQRDEQERRGVRGWLVDADTGEEGFFNPQQE